MFSVCVHVGATEGPAQTNDLWTVTTGMHLLHTHTHKGTLFQLGEKFCNLKLSRHKQNCPDAANVT